jgi:hypothetical protein
MRNNDRSGSLKGCGRIQIDRSCKAGRFKIDSANAARIGGANADGTLEAVRQAAPAVCRQPCKQLEQAK